MAKDSSAPPPIDDGLKARGWRAIRTNLGLDLAPAKQWWNLQAKLDLGTRIGEQEKRIFAGHHNDGDDAMRHAEWSRRMADEIGPGFARLAGLGHEVQNIFGQNGVFQPLSEGRMDMHNNAEGLRSFREGRPIDPGQFQATPRPTPLSGMRPRMAYSK